MHSQGFQLRESRVTAGTPSTHQKEIDVSFVWFAGSGYSVSKLAVMELSSLDTVRVLFASNSVVVVKPMRIGVHSAPFI